MMRGTPGGRQRAEGSVCFTIGAPLGGPTSATCRGSQTPSLPRSRWFCVSRLLCAWATTKNAKNKQLFIGLCSLLWGVGCPDHMHRTLFVLLANRFPKLHAGAP